MGRLSRLAPPLALALAAVTACGAEADPTGTWLLWSVDDTPPVEAPAARRELQDSNPDIWTEATLDSLELRILPGGDYRAVRRERVAVVATPAAYRRLTGRAWQGGGLARQAEDPARKETIGRWEIRRSSLVLRQSEEQLRRQAAEALRAVNPALAPEAIAARIDSLLRANRPPPEFEGTFDGSRLELRDRLGRRLVLHRRGAAGME